MKILNLLNNDCYSEACYKVLAATLPFINIGLIGNKAILYISSVIGVIALALLAGRLFAKSPAAEKKTLCRDVDDILVLPYAFALSSAIVDMKIPGLASSGYWFALILAIFIVIGNHIKIESTTAGTEG